jgi:predicted dehydrogenase
MRLPRPAIAVGSAGHFHEHDETESMSEAYGIGRRQFLKAGARAAGLGAAGACAAPMVVPASVLGSNGAAPPSERIAVGFIGLGNQGVGRNLRMFLQQDDAQPVALCDVDRRRIPRAMNHVRDRFGEGYTCQRTQDFREVIERDDVDAVMISTPDHWHVPLSLAAIRAGKDVICEKPTRTVNEGRALADTVARYNAVFQTSTEDRSVGLYHRMAELVRNGRIGKLQRIEVTLPHKKDVAGDATPQPVPEEFDYEMWLGPAPWAPYTPDRCHYNFRFIEAYSGGTLTDWGMHMLDTAQWANDTERTGPVEVEGTGRRYDDPLYDTFETFDLTWRYADGVELHVRHGGTGIRFIGTEGWLGNAGWRQPLQASDERILRSEIGPEETHLFTEPRGEHRNFLDCIKSRRDLYFPAEIGHRCATIQHIGNIAMTLGRKLKWDPDAERFENDATANRMLGRDYRESWGL